MIVVPERIMPKSIAQRQDPFIVFLLKVLETKNPAAGKEIFIGTGRVTSFHGEIEEGL